jgi:methionine-rich copper-binding protein CopC
MRYIMIGLLLIAMLLGVSMAAATDTVTRTLPATAAPGEDITVTFTIDFEDAAATTQLAITETVPPGWTVVSASDGGNTVAQPGKILWVKADAVGNMPADGATYTYIVTVPADASGTATFSGVYGTNVAGTDIAILGNTELSIESVAATDTVTRTLPATATPGEDITVTFTIDFEDAAATTQLAITETVPPGWTVVSASDGGNTVAQHGKISWVKADTLGNMPADGAIHTYIVTVPADASGTATFSGVYGTNVAGTDIAILGNTEVTIGEPLSPCYIATASYGTPLHSDINILRSFRDKMLMPNPIGEAFVSTYYRTSPPIADALRGNDGLRTVTRSTLITPLVSLSKFALNGILLVFIIIGLTAVLSFRKDRTKILKSLLVGTGSILVFIAAIFSLGFVGYAIPFCAVVGAHLLPLVIPLSVVFTLCTLLKLHINASGGAAIKAEEEVRG